MTAYILSALGAAPRWSGSRWSPLSWSFCWLRFRWFSQFSRPIQQRRIPWNRTLTMADVIGLRDAGVSERVLNFMINTPDLWAAQ